MPDGVDMTTVSLTIEKLSDDNMDAAIAGMERAAKQLSQFDVDIIYQSGVLGDDPAQIMMRQVIALFDEYQSRENAKHVIRAMKENTRQGFWNGSRPPLGYRAVDAEMRGQRIKRKIAMDPVEAELVRLIFRLVLEGDNGSGPMGIKALTSWLNSRGYRTRGGACWGVGQIHGLLTNPVYAGRLRFNRVENKTRRVKPASEHVYCDAPAIIEADVFERVQAQLKARNPHIVASRVVTGPILLTGLTPDLIARFSTTMREQVTSGEIAFRKAYMGAIIDRIEVDDREIRILDRKDVLEQCVIGGAKPTGVVRSSVRGWLGN